MTALWTSAEAAVATGGRATGPDWRATGISIDSRTLAPGDLFVALAGPNHDAHDYVGEALAAGAAAALVHRAPAGIAADAPLLMVGDTLTGLTALAKAARRRSSARIAAVTGSVGKTGTKEMLNLALGAAGQTYATAGNLNNHWGVPLSLSRLPVAARFGVFELGMNHPGEIAPLSRMVRPDVAVITAIEAVHLAFFASTRQIAEAKAEIFQGVEAGGIAILPRDNPHYEQLRDAAHAAGIGRVQSFGNHIEANARLLHCGVDQSGTTVFALIEEREVSYRIGVPGRHWASNSLAVLLAAEALGVDAKIAANALANMAAPKGRGERRSLPWGTGSILVIDESYNASPASMRAAIANLGAAHVEAKGRRIAVLGDMLELGDAAATLHAGLAESLRHWRIDKVFTVGPLMRHLHDALPAACRAGHADSSDLAAQPVAAMARAGDAIMVKGSAGSRMSRVVQTLDALAAPMKPVANGN